MKLSNYCQPVGKGGVMKSASGPLEYSFKSSFPPTFFDTVESGNRCTLNQPDCSWGQQLTVVV